MHRSTSVKYRGAFLNNNKKRVKGPQLITPPLIKKREKQKAKKCKTNSAKK